MTSEDDKELKEHPAIGKLLYSLGVRLTKLKTDIVNIKNKLTNLETFIYWMFFLQITNFCVVFIILAIVISQLLN